MSVVLNLNKTIGDFHLRIPRWEISDQGITALVGPSGAGKSTVLRILLGLEKAAGYTWQFGGEDLAKLPPGRRHIGVVFQGYELFPHMTGRENIFFAAKVRGISTATAKERWDKLNHVLQLSQFGDRTPAQMSGGEQQRVALARALMGFPRMLFLDEPFSAMDENLREDSRGLVAQVLQESGIPAVLITHDDRDILALKPRVFRLESGRLVD